MVKNQLHTLQAILRTVQDKQLQMFNICEETVTFKDCEQVIYKGSKVFQQIIDALLLIGTLQLLRKHIGHQLNTSSKFDSAHVEASLRTFNE